jgi:hypothetical protein
MQPEPKGQPAQAAKAGAALAPKATTQDNLRTEQTFLLSPMEAGLGLALTLNTRHLLRSWDPTVDSTGVLRAQTL